MAGYAVTDILTQAGAEAINNQTIPMVVGVEYDSSTGNAQGFTFRGGTLLRPAPLSANGYANSVDNAETVVGRFGRDRWSGRAFSYNVGSRVLFDLQAHLGGVANGEARDINNNNLVVGGVWDGVAQSSFVYDLKAKKLTKILLPGFQSSMAVSINDNNQVVGIAWPSSDLYAGHKAYLYDAAAGTTKILADGMSPYGINSAGVVAGCISPGVNPVVCSPPAYAPVVIGPNAPPSPPTSNGTGCAYGINKLGDVVGTVGLGNMHGFIYSLKTGTFVDLNSFFPGVWKIIIATAINDAGCIAAGALQLSSGAYKAVLLTPA